MIALACFLLTRRLDVRRPSKTQAALELIVSSLQNMANGLIGPEGPRYLPVVGTLFIYILILNLSGAHPALEVADRQPECHRSPWRSSRSSTCSIQGIRANGLVGYLKHFVGEPIWMAPLNIPLHIIGELARPVSLCFRLFGNIFGEDTVIAILIMLGA